MASSGGYIFACSPPDVAAPSDFELPYENLELKTPDEITLRCYLLPQKKELEHGATYMDIPKEMSEDEVSKFLFPLLAFYAQSKIMRERELIGYYNIASSSPAGPPSSCSMEMGETLGTGSRSRAYSSKRCAVMC